MQNSYPESLSPTDDDEEPPRQHYKPEIPQAAIKKIIGESMAEYGIRKRDIPGEGLFTSPDNTKGSKRYFESKGFAWFSCPKKHHRWPSAHSWCFIDLKEQVICYRDEQKCRKCNSKAMGPEFTEESLVKMATYVVKQYLIRIGKLKPLHPTTATVDTSETQGGPHDEQRCGKCRRLGRSCWKRQV